MCAELQGYFSLCIRGILVLKKSIVEMGRCLSWGIYKFSIFLFSFFHILLLSISTFVFSKHIFPIPN